MKTLIAYTMHIFFYNFFDISDFAEASDLRISVSETLESHDNDWTSAPFQTTFDLPQDIALLADKVRIHFPADAAQPPSDQVRIFEDVLVINGDFGTRYTSYTEKLIKKLNYVCSLILVMIAI